MDDYRDTVDCVRGGGMTITKITGSGCYDLRVVPNDSDGRLVIDYNDFIEISEMLDKAFM